MKRNKEMWEKLREFVIGMGTAFDLSGSIGEVRLRQLSERSPEEEIERAWRTTGDALRQAMNAIGVDVVNDNGNVLIERNGSTTESPRPTGQLSERTHDAEHAA